MNPHNRGLHGSRIVAALLFQEAFMNERINFRFVYQDVHAAQAIAASHTMHTHALGCGGGRFVGSGDHGLGTPEGYARF